MNLILKFLLLFFVSMVSITLNAQMFSVLDKEERINKRAQ